MTGQSTEVIRRAVAAAVADMTPEQRRNLVIGPYLDVREDLTASLAA